jgi:hypothetical protein
VYALTVPSVNIPVPVLVKVPEPLMPPEPALVPEPASIGLLSVGAIGLLGRRRRQAVAK